jgi:Cu2+-containing amine oxidase
MKSEELRQLIRILLREVLIELYEKTKNGEVGEGLDELSPGTYKRAADKRLSQAQDAVSANDFNSAEKLVNRSFRTQDHATKKGANQKWKAWNTDPAKKGRLLNKEEKKK